MKQRFLPSFWRWRCCFPAAPHKKVNHPPTSSPRPRLSRQIVGAITAGTDLTVATLFPSRSLVSTTMPSPSIRCAPSSRRSSSLSAAQDSKNLWATLLPPATLSSTPPEGLALLPRRGGRIRPAHLARAGEHDAMTHTVETALAAEYPRTPPCRGKCGHLVRKIGRAAVLRRAASCRSLLPQARHLPRRLCLLCQGF